MNDVPAPPASDPHRSHVERLLVTVGAQMPFDRLVAAVDEWFGRHRDLEGLAQIGEGGTPPRHLPHVTLLAPHDLRREIQASDLVVAHAGMGTVITCLELARPLIVFPRRGDLRETRNDHQIATATRLGSRPGIGVAFDTDTLHRLLDRRADLAASVARQPPTTSPRLLAAIRELCDA